MLKNIVISAATSLVVAVVLLVGFATGDKSTVQPQFAGTETVLANLAGGVKIGSYGTILSQEIVGTCTLIGTTGTYATANSRAFDCAIPNVKTGDIIFGAVSTTTQQTGGGFVVSGAKASTTAGYATFILSNATGATVAPGNTGANQIQYRITKTKSY